MIGIKNPLMLQGVILIPARLQSHNGYQVADKTYACHEGREKHSGILKSPNSGQIIKKNLIKKNLFGSAPMDPGLSTSEAFRTTGRTHSPCSGAPAPRASSSRQVPHSLALLGHVHSEPRDPNTFQKTSQKKNPGRIAGF